MKAIMVMFDSLNRHMLPPYGGDWLHAPNFQRLAGRSVTFDNCYAGSLPCMPARRDLHTGRVNFFHRRWGPIEPFDDSMPELLKRRGIHTHLVSDHHHYWEDGGATYHSRYSTWEGVRGQEYDPWKGQVEDPVIPPSIGHDDSAATRQYWANRRYFESEVDHPIAQTFTKGLAFIENNRRQEGWFLQLEAFDPHEPFFASRRFEALYPHDYHGPHFDWPKYGPVEETAEQVRHARLKYAALVSMCDAYLGKVLDLMDTHDLWRDTLLIVNTDHGFLLGDHGYWGKLQMPWYNELVHLPLFVWDPRKGRCGERCGALVQTIDLAPTLLEFFGVPVPPDMQGYTLEALVSGSRTRDAALFGMHGRQVNCTDGRYVYMRAPVADNAPLFNYTLLPTRIKGFFDLDELRGAELVQPFSFTKGCAVLKVKETRVPVPRSYEFETLMFDLHRDPSQGAPINDADTETLYDPTDDPSDGAERPHLWNNTHVSVSSPPLELAFSPSPISAFEGS